MLTQPKLTPTPQPMDTGGKEADRGHWRPAATTKETRHIGLFNARTRTNEQTDELSVLIPPIGVSVAKGLMLRRAHSSIRARLTMKARSRKAKSAGEARFSRFLKRSLTSKSEPELVESSDEEFSPREFGEWLMSEVRRHGSLDKWCQKWEFEAVPFWNECLISNVPLFFVKSFKTSKGSWSAFRMTGAPFSSAVRVDFFKPQTHQHGKRLPHGERFRDRTWPCLSRGETCACLG